MSASSKNSIAPLVSFVVASYNQERFIRSALEGAFSQTYSPLEIVISDDCSKDRTFDIAREMAAAYRGPHTVRLNRNEQNLGIGGHCSYMMTLCRGDLVVLAAGDDISVPERTAVNVQAWADSGFKATSIYSRFTIIDDDGREVGEGASHAPPDGERQFIHQKGSTEGFLRRRSPHVFGCAHAISPRLFSLFGPFPKTVTYEDTALCYRTILAGGLFTYVDRPLVRYRRHQQNITFGLHQVRPRSERVFNDSQEKRRCELDRFIRVYDCFEKDTQRALEQGLLSQQQFAETLRRVVLERRRMALMRDLLLQGWLARCGIFLRLYTSTVRPRELLTQLPHLLPRPVYRAGVTRWNQFRHGSLPG